MIRSPTYSKRAHRIERNMVTPGGVGRRRSWRSARVASVACFTYRWLNNDAKNKIK